MSRSYSPEDLAAVQRIWKEIGWVDGDDEAAQLEYFLAGGDVRLAEIGDEVVCSVSTHPGTFRYESTDLPAHVVSSVTTSWVGRKQGFARTLTAEVLETAAQDGSAIALLGMFEQGFYNRLGFGCGRYEHIAHFDPGQLRVATPFRPPIRLGADDYEEVAAAHGRRKRSHGGVTVDSPDWMRAELGSAGFALGYRDAADRLTHFITGRTKGESGPYSIDVIGYETTEQLMELLALVQGLGDQVRSVSMAEPPEIQIQDLLVHPNRHKIVTKGTKWEVGVRATAWWQARMLDVSACVGATIWEGQPIRFNLDLSDPIDAVLAGDWTGVGGTYVVELGRPSSAVNGPPLDDLPTMRASVNAFTRLWMGALPASSLALVDDLDCPSDLLELLDRALRLPPPRPGMFF